MIALETVTLAQCIEVLEARRQLIDGELHDYVRPVPACDIDYNTLLAERAELAASLSHLREELANCQQLNLAVQQFLRDWGNHSQRRNPAVMLDQASMPWFAALNGSLLDTLDDDAFRARLRESAARLAALAQELLDRGCGEQPRLDGSALAAAIKAAGGAPAGFGPMLFAAAEFRYVD